MWYYESTILIKHNMIEWFCDIRLIGQLPKIVLDKRWKNYCRLFRMFFCECTKIHSLQYRFKRLTVILDLPDHESGHEKSPHSTIKGLQVDFRETLNVNVRENRCVDPHSSLRRFCIPLFEAKTPNEPLKRGIWVHEFSGLDRKQAEQTAKIVISSIFQFAQLS